MNKAVEYNSEVVPQVKSFGGTASEFQSLIETYDLDNVFSILERENKFSRLARLQIFTTWGESYKWTGTRIKLVGSKWTKCHGGRELGIHVFCMAPTNALFIMDKDSYREFGDRIKDWRSDYNDVFIIDGEIQQ